MINRDARFVVIAAVLMVLGFGILAHPQPRGNPDSRDMRFSGWRVYFMTPPDKLDERSVGIALTDTDELVIHDAVELASGQRHNRPRILLPLHAYVNYLRLPIKDISSWHTVSARGYFPRRKVIRIFFSQDGVDRYAILGTGGGLEDDAMSHLIFASELAVRTGLPDLQFPPGGVQPR